MNILAVSLGALFNEIPVTVSYSTSFQQIRSLALHRTNINDNRDRRGTTSMAQLFSHFYILSANLSTGNSLRPWVDSNFTYLPYNPTSTSSQSSGIYTAATRGLGVDPNCVPVPVDKSVYPHVQYAFYNDGNQTLSVMFKRDDGTVSKCIPHYNPSENITGFDIPIGKAAQELSTQLIDPGNNETAMKGELFCGTKILLGWLRFNGGANNPINQDRSYQTVQSRFLVCSPQFRTAMFNVQVDSSGYVMGSERIGELEDVGAVGWDASTQANIAFQISDTIGPNSASFTASSSTTYKIGWHNDTLTRDWMNYLVKEYMNSTAFVNSEVELPAPETLIAPVTAVYRMLFSSIMGLDFSIFENTSQPVNLQGTVTVQETRIFMDITALYISTVLLGLTVIVVLVFYSQQRRGFLPRLPSSIGSITAFVAASRAVRELRPPERQPHWLWLRGGDRRPRRLITTYSYGKYLGVDGKQHVGIEMDPFVRGIEEIDPGRRSILSRLLPRNRRARR
jgi:hypothetical protein